MPPARPPLLRFLVLIARRFRAHRCADLAAALTLGSLLALVPLLSFALGVFALSPWFGPVSKAFETFVFSNLVPEAAGRVTTTYVLQFAREAKHLTAWGAALFAASGLFVIVGFNRACNAIWQVRRAHPFLGRAWRYALLLVAAPLLLTMGLAAVTSAVRVALVGVPLRSIGESMLLGWMPAVSLAVALALAYRLLPRAHVPWRHALAGGIAVALGLEVMKQAFGWYAVHVANYRVIYGAFASVPIFLLWLYVCWVLVLGGALVTASVGYWGDPEPRPFLAPAEQARAATAILYALALRAAERDADAGGPPEARRARTLAGPALGAEALARASGLRLDQLAAVLEELCEAGWIERQRGACWASRRPRPDGGTLLARFEARALPR